MHLVYDDYVYKKGLADANIYLRQVLQSDTTLGLYHPVVYPSDFWVLRKHLLPLNESTTVN